MLSAMCCTERWTSRLQGLLAILKLPVAVWGILGGAILSGADSPLLWAASCCLANQENKERLNRDWCSSITYKVAMSAGAQIADPNTTQHALTVFTARAADCPMFAYPVAKHRFTVSEEP